MTVLSLFDGISCGQVALHRAGLPITQYYASEIDPEAITVAMRNHPNTIQLGDVRNLDETTLPQHVDLILAGSPCQGFSNSGLRGGIDDPRSALFFEFLRIKSLYPNALFLLENVSMRKDWLQIITDYMGVEPIKINSSLVSAQQRKRYYWTNIPNVTQPEDKGIHIIDILEDNVDEKYWLKEEYLRSKNIEWLHQIQEELVNKPHQLTSLCGGSQAGRIYDVMGKSKTLVALAGGLGVKTGLYMVPKVIQRCDRGPWKGSGMKDYVKVPCLTSSSWQNNFYLALEQYGVRRFTPIEAERAQTLPDAYTEGFSDNKRYKMLGNAWTVDVVAHILGHISC